MKLSNGCHSSDPYILAVRDRKVHIPWTIGSAKGLRNSESISVSRFTAFNRVVILRYNIPLAFKRARILITKKGERNETIRNIR